MGRDVKSNCQILLVQETAVLVVDRSSRRQKTNKLKLVKQCGRQESKIKALRATRTLLSCLATSRVNIFNK